MINKYSYQLILLIVLLVFNFSCENEPYVSVPDTNANQIWEYNGERKTITNVISSLQNSPESAIIEKNLGNRILIWEATKPLLIDGKKRLLIPITNKKRNKIMGVVSLMKDSNGKIKHDFVNRRSIFKKNSKFPYWSKGIWYGYIKALEKVVLNYNNDNQGIWSQKLEQESNRKKNSNYAKSSGYEVCELYEIEECWVNVLYEDDSLEDIIAIDVVHCETYYEEECFEVYEEDEECYDETNPDCTNYDPLYR